eukprot:s985_g22.t1
MKVKVVRKRKDAAAASSSPPKPAEAAADAAKPLIRRQEARRKAKAKAGTESTMENGGDHFFVLLTLDERKSWLLSQAHKEELESV